MLSHNINPASAADPRAATACVNATDGTDGDKLFPTSTDPVRRSHKAAWLAEIAGKGLRLTHDGAIRVMEGA